MNFDLTTTGGIAAAVLSLIGAVKLGYPGIKGKEPIISLILGVLLAVASKAGGIGFATDHWIAVVGAGLFAGVGAQVAHDKAVNPLRGKEPHA